MSDNLPQEYHFSSDHHWAFADENLLTVGLTEFAVEKLGEVLYLDLPEEGTKVYRREVFGNSESVMQIRDLVSPVSGTIIEINHRLFDDPGLLNDDPYGDGWIVKIEFEKEDDLMDLIRSPEYLELIAGQQ